MNKVLSWVFFLMIVAVFAISFYSFFFKKNLIFTIEASCNPAVESCFIRDCTNADDCPPNELSSYKQFLIKGSDFERCTNDECQNICFAGSSICTPVQCGESEEDVCTGTEE